METDPDMIEKVIDKIERSSLSSGDDLSDSLQASPGMYKKTSNKDNKKLSPALTRSLKK